MPFTMLVCADLFSDKVNLEIPFPEKPTLEELRSHVQNQFTAEMRALQPPNMAAIDQFVVSRVQIYDDVNNSWVDLSSPQQLHEFDQLYCFQPLNPWQNDLQKDLPPPRPPTVPVPFTGGGGAWSGQQPVSQPAAALAAAPLQLSYQQPQAPPSQPMYVGGGLPQPHSLAAASGERPNIPLEERIRVSFQEIDEQRKGWVDSTELERAFRNRGIDFSASTVNELFQKADGTREGRLDAQKWHHFATVYPNTVDAVYYRGRDMRSEQHLRDEMAGAQRELEAGRAKEHELRAAAEAQAQHNQRLAAQLQSNEIQLRETTDRRNLLEGQERALIEQEVKLERQKDALRISMSKFKETANAFDRDAATTGSPRRSRAPPADLAGL
eukprot:Rhum_TRINITY_DN14488_c15_g1::Rhum_TRINITY_DN14488_c15_g1_i1::g.92685::m.92685